MYNTIYDATYAGLSAVMALVLLATVVRGARQRATATDPSRRTQATAIMVAAVGVLASLVAGVGLQAIRSTTGDLLYQQVHFAVFYVGFGLVLVGSDRVVSDDRTADPSPVSPDGWRRWRWTLWGIWAAATAVGVAKLATAGVGAPQADRRVPQEPIYFLPVLVALVIVTVVMLALAGRTSDRGWRRQVVIWFGLFGGLLFIGFLREATIVPSTNEPIVDLLLAFGPFAAATLCLYQGLRSTISRSAV
jgi:uncharacterized membrane protein YidH (DUF202 family)